MIRILKEAEVSRDAIFAREDPVESVEAPVRAIIEDVKANGDAALKKYTKEFDGADITSVEVGAGSIEIAPILDMTDVIVDIVETGTTLKENNLSPIETIVPISARLIANKVSFKFKHEAIQQLYESLSDQVAAKEAEAK